jgi:ATP-dependent RNA helicase DHX29
MLSIKASNSPLHRIRFQLISGCAIIDRKVKVRLSPKANVAMKHLRSQLGSILADQFIGKPLSETQIAWNDMALVVLGKKSKPDETGCVPNDSVVVT